MNKSFQKEWTVGCLYLDLSQSLQEPVNLLLALHRGVLWGPVWTEMMLWMPARSASRNQIVAATIHPYNHC